MKFHFEDSIIAPPPMPSDKPLLDAADDLGEALDTLKATGKGRRRVARLARRVRMMAGEIVRFAETTEDHTSVRTN